MNLDATIFCEQPLTLAALSQRLVALASLEPGTGETIGERGGLYQRDRITAIAEWACATGPGDLAEIGCYSGDTTVRLCEVARRSGRRVAALDLWPANTPYDLAEKVYPEFSEKTASYADVLDVFRAEAEGEAAARWLGARALRFAFVDCDKIHEHVRAQLRSVMPICSGPIALDDAYVLDVIRAADEMARENPPWVHLRISSLRESWLVRSDAR